MEIISIRFKEDILTRIDEYIKSNNYNSRTEFIREAVREKIAKLSKQNKINETNA
jgi:metal-responsive CopG/Arc/MetJ family transcriptional regulator